jgi:hypothetical protein
MITSYSNPFEALFALQRALEGKPIAFLGIEQGTSCDLLARDSH